MALVSTYVCPFCKRRLYPARLHLKVSPDFFAGTAVEAAVGKLAA